MTTENRRRTADLMRRLGPDHFDMDYFFHDGWSRQLREASRVDLTACGTTACLAGTAATLMLAGQDSHYETGLAAKTAAWLGVRDRVFYTNEWPPTMRAAYDRYYNGMANRANRASQAKAEWLTVLDLLDGKFPGNYVTTPTQKETH